MAGFFSGMTAGAVTRPNTVVGVGPLPPLSTSGFGAEFKTPDGLINETAALLDGVSPYSYGPNAARPSTQTSYVNHPHRVQHVIPKMFLPNATGTGRDLALEHALSDGDLTFTLRMPKEMIVGPSEFCQARNIPARVLAPLVNLATVNYLLWGLQIGRTLGDPRTNRWQDFYLRLSQGRVHRHTDVSSQRDVWHFLQTFLQPYGVMTGSDMQGGQHEGGVNRVATYPVDYVGSFLVDGHCRKTNNLWRHQGIAAGNDLCLELRMTGRNERNLHHSLVSGARATCEASTSTQVGWWFLAPAVTDVNTWDIPHIHVGRSIGMYSAYQTQAQLGQAPWSAPAAILGKGVEMVFAPEFNTPEWMDNTDTAPAYAPQHTGAAPHYVREEQRRDPLAPVPPGQEPDTGAAPDPAEGGDPGAAAEGAPGNTPSAGLARTAAQAFGGSDTGTAKKRPAKRRPVLAPGTSAGMVQGAMGAAASPTSAGPDEPPQAAA